MAIVSAKDAKDVRDRIVGSANENVQWANILPRQDVASFVLERMLEHDDGERVLIEMADDESDRMTARQWVTEALRLRRALAGDIVDTTQVTLLASRNSCLFAVAAHAAMSLGRFSALVVDQPLHVWTSQLSVVRPSVILVEAPLLQQLLQALNEAHLERKAQPRVVQVPTRFLSAQGRFERLSVSNEHLDIVQSYQDLVGDVPDRFDLREELNAIRRVVDPLAEVCYLPFTSGTTSASKAYCYTHAEAMLWPIMTAGMPSHDSTTGGVLKIPVFTPQCHMWAMSTSSLVNPVRGTTAHVQRVPPTDELSCVKIAESIVLHRYSTIAITPWSLRVIARRCKHMDFSFVQSVAIGASPTPPYEMRRLRKLFPNASFRSAYASTELGLMAVDQGDADVRRDDPYAVGQLTPSRKMLVASIDAPLLANGCRPLLKAGERGELLFNEQLPLNNGIQYLDNEEGSRRMRSEYEGFYRTGDFGYFKENGAVYVEDRCQDMICLHRADASEGSKPLYIAPALVEAILSAFDARIADVGVVRRPRQGASDVVDALVVVEQDLQLDGEALRRFLRDELASLPSDEVEEGVADALTVRHLRVLSGGVDDTEAPIARTALGKTVRRHLMRDQALARIDA